MLIEDDSQRIGCASCLSVWCSLCGCSEVFIPYVMRLLGCCLSAMEWFCSTMNMPPPVNPKAFNYHNKAIIRAVKDVAE
jgi:hypothetical protein